MEEKKLSLLLSVTEFVSDRFFIMSCSDLNHKNDNNCLLRENGFIICDNNFR